MEVRHIILQIMMYTTQSSTDDSECYLLITIIEETLGARGDALPRLATHPAVPRTLNVFFDLSIFFFSKVEVRDLILQRVDCNSALELGLNATDGKGHIINREEQVQM